MLVLSNYLYTIGHYTTPYDCLSVLVYYTIHTGVTILQLLLTLRGFADCQNFVVLSTVFLSPEFIHYNCVLKIDFILST